MPFRTSASTILGVVLLAGPALAQSGDQAGHVTLVRRNMGGPRIGITYAASSSDLAGNRGGNGSSRILSQFGWHFEYQVIPEGGGPQFVIQFVPLVAGVEHGIFLPSVNLMMGVRLPNGIEFGLGPNAVATDDDVQTALVIGVGKSFDYGGVSIPVNVAFATNPHGHRFSFVIGYAIQR